MLNSYSNFCLLKVALQKVTWCDMSQGYFIHFLMKFQSISETGLDQKN